MADFIRDSAWPFFTVFMIALALTVLSPDIYELAVSRKNSGDDQ